MVCPSRSSSANAALILRSAFPERGGHFAEELGSDVALVLRREAFAEVVKVRAAGICGA